MRSTVLSFLLLSARGGVAALAAWLVWRMPEAAGWHLAVGGSLAVVLLVFLNSMRMLNVK